jgi:hypothetical protein
MREYIMGKLEKLYKKWISPQISPKDFYKKPTIKDISKCGNTASPVFSNPDVYKAFRKLQEKDLTSKF